MGKLKNIYFGIQKKFDDKLNKIFEGKDKEKFLYVISLIVNSIIIIGVIINLLFLAQGWTNSSLGWCLFDLYFSTFLGLFCMRNLIKDSKKYLNEKSNKPKKTKTEKKAHKNKEKKTDKKKPRKKLSEIVEEEMQTENQNSEESEESCESAE